MNLPGVVPIPWFKRVLYFLQATVLFVVYFGFLTLALFELAQFWTTKPTAIQIALMVYRFQTLFSFMGLFFWYFNLGDLKLKEYILNSSNGVGIVKNSSKLKICNVCPIPDPNLSFLYSLFLCFMVWQDRRFIWPFLAIFTVHFPKQKLKRNRYYFWLNLGLFCF